MALDRSMDRRLRGIMTGALCTMQPRVYVVMCVYREHVLWEILVKKNQKNCVLFRGIGRHYTGTVITGVVTFGPLVVLTSVSCVVG